MKGLRPRQVYRLRRAFPADEPLVLASRKRETATGTDCAPSADGWPISIRSIAWLSTRRMAPTGRGHFDEYPSRSVVGRFICGVLPVMKARSSKSKARRDNDAALSLMRKLLNNQQGVPHRSSLVAIAATMLPFVTLACRASTVGSGAEYQT